MHTYILKKRKTSLISINRKSNHFGNIPLGKRTPSLKQTKEAISYNHQDNLECCKTRHDNIETKHCVGILWQDKQKGGRVGTKGIQSLVSL